MSQKTCSIHMLSSGLFVDGKSETSDGMWSRRRRDLHFLFLIAISIPRSRPRRAESLSRAHDSDRPCEEPAGIRRQRVDGPERVFHHERRRRS